MAVEASNKRVIWDNFSDKPNTNSGEMSYCRIAIHEKLTENEDYFTCIE